MWWNALRELAYAYTAAHSWPRVFNIVWILLSPLLHDIWVSWFSFKHNLKCVFKRVGIFSCISTGSRLRGYGTISFFMPPWPIGMLAGFTPDKMCFSGSWHIWPCHCPCKADCLQYDMDVSPGKLVQFSTWCKKNFFKWLACLPAHVRLRDSLIMECIPSSSILVLPICKLVQFCSTF